MKSGIPTVSACVLCVLGAVTAGDPASRLALPEGVAATVYARGLRGADDLEVRPDGTLTLRGGRERYEIAPATADQPVTVMRVAQGLADGAPPADPTALALRAPGFVRLRWESASGELRYSVTPGAATQARVAPQLLAVARELARRHHARVALAPDGALYFADYEAGTVWRIERQAL